MQHNRIREAFGCLKIIERKYPFVPKTKQNRQYSDYRKLRVFVRDGFVDRYSGDKLIFSPVLRLLSILMPNEFPFHKNWKMTECHLGFWQLLPTVDHVIPVSRGGPNEESIMVCTSQLRNSAKANWLLEELEWELQPPGDFSKWDGLMNWFIRYLMKYPSFLQNGYLNSWYKAAMRVIKT